MQSKSAAFLSMGTEMTLTATGIAETAFHEGVAWTIDAASRWEHHFSRFDPTSELSRLNATAGTTQNVSAEMFSMLEQALAGFRTTGGLFDPGILPVLERLGYDEDFRHVAERENGCARSSGANTTFSSIGKIRLCQDGLRFHLPAGMRLDLGGIAKGAFADRVAAELSGWTGGCIDAGGDLVTWGMPPDGFRWRIGVERPDHTGSHVAVVTPNSNGPLAVATSGRNRRKWSSPEGQQHHLVDPITNLPAQTTWLSVTAFHESATAADIAAKAAMIASGRNQRWTSEETVLLFAAGNNELEVHRGSKAPLVEIFTTETIRATA